MALRFADSFDHYATADVLTKWTSMVATPAIGATGRNSTSGVRLNASGTTMTKTIDSQATWFIGFAFKVGTAPAATAAILQIIDDVTLHVDLRLSAGGILSVTRNGTNLGTGTAVLAVGTYYYIEIKVTISDTVGVAVVKVNGVTDINLSSQDTRNGANASADRIRLVGIVATTDFDDFYVCDATGSAPTNDFLGDVRVETILPSGNGNSSVLVGSDGNSTDNYLLVDETAPNSDTDYVESSTVGDKDTYVYGNVTPTTGTVYGVQVLPFAKKTDAGARSIVSVARLSATEVDSTDKTLNTTYGYLPDIREAKPGGGVWSITDVNNAEFGVKVTA